MSGPAILIACGLLLIAVLTVYFWCTDDDLPEDW